jgi:hypothetical protein
MLIARRVPIPKIHTKKNSTPEVKGDGSRICASDGMKLGTGNPVLNFLQSNCQRLNGRLKLKSKHTCHVVNLLGAQIPRSCNNRFDTF